jgi:cyclopropane fatty-acyl-phospholipid synthase-like methyltransferase
MSINQQYIDGEYTSKNPSFHIEDSPWKARQILQGINRAKLQPTRIAEIGCGAGEILVQLSKALPDKSFYGYELSPQGYAMCQKREASNIHYFNEDLFSAENEFDLMLCIDVFEHIEDPYSFLRNLAKTSRNFIFHIPLDMNVQMVARARPLQMVRESVGHLHYFSKDTALETLKHCGFEINDWFFTPNGVDRPKTIQAKALQLPRKFFQAINIDLTARFLGGYSLLVVASHKDS